MSKILNLVGDVIIKIFVISTVFIKNVILYLILLKKSYEKHFGFFRRQIVLIRNKILIL